MIHPSIFRTFLVFGVLCFCACEDDSRPTAQPASPLDVGSTPQMDASPPLPPLDMNPPEEDTPAPVLHVDQPLSGTFISRNAGTILVSGRVEMRPKATDHSLRSQVNLGIDGSFSHEVSVETGIQHIDVLYAQPPETILKVRRSVLVGADTPWDVNSTAAVGAQINPSALERLNEALSGPAARQLIQDSILDSTGEDDDDDLEIHEVNYDELDVNLSFQDGYILARVAIVNFAIRLTYRYELLGIDAEVSGWARAERVRVTAEIRLIQSPDGSYNLEVTNPEVELDELELDLTVSMKPSNPSLSP